MEKIHSSSSFARLWRQLIFVPIWHNRWLTSDNKATLAKHIEQAEQGHQGEICLIIENHLPIRHAYHQGCRERALDLFAHYRVWDTENNSGILIYINLCEHDLEVIADRGINQKAQKDAWQTLCQKTLTHFKNQNMLGGISELIDEIGKLLRQHYPNHDTASNELPNHPIYLK